MQTGMPDVKRDPAAVMQSYLRACELDAPTGCIMVSKALAKTEPERALLYANRAAELVKSGGLHVKTIEERSRSEARV